MPDTISESVPQPLVELFELGLNTGQSVVVYPAHPYLSEFLKSLFKNVWQGVLGDYFELTFQVFPALLLHYQLVFALFSLFVGWYEAVTQKLKVGGSSDSAFLPVDRQVQFVLQEQIDFITYFLGGCF